MRSSFVLASCLAALSVACGGESHHVGSGSGSGGSGGGGGGQPPDGKVSFFHDGSVVTRIFAAEQVEVKVTGLQPKEHVTITGALQGFVSEATFEADGDGVVDLAKQAPLSGTWKGVDADGLFWSMKNAHDDAVVDPTDADVMVEVKADDGLLRAAGKLHRFAIADGVVETMVNDDGLVGVLVTPGDGKPHPVMITFGGSEGGLSGGQHYAEFYASLGYTCLGLAYFAAPGLPDLLNEVPLEYFGTAIDWVKQRPEANPDAIGVLGASRGGELALILGANFPELLVVIAQVPSGLVWPGYDNQKGYISSWTLNGVDLPFMPIPTDVKPTYADDGHGHSVEHDTPMFDKTLDEDGPAAIETASTHVEDGDATYLMIAGGADELWPSCRLSEIAMKRLTNAGHDVAHGDQRFCYPGAGHGIGSPGWPTTISQNVVHPITMQLLALGGDPEGIAHADRDAYEKKKALLAAKLK
jgi:acetyl esterase/lipase